MREIRNINAGWLFEKEGKKETVDLPHTWNGSDGQDGGNDYYRGKCRYEKTLLRSDLPAGQVVYLQIDGANSSAEVFLNGKKLSTHHGGYSSFRVKLDGIRDENRLCIAVDNAPNDCVYPQNADFTFYGGLYRDVTLIGVGKNHFDLSYFGSRGIAITPEVRDGYALVNVKTYVEGQGLVTVTIGEQSLCGKDVTFRIDAPHLWNGTADPYLYTVSAVLTYNGEAVDAISDRFGIRSFSVDPEKGFFLNGKAYPLRGVARHQDRPGIGNALRYEHHKEDVELICEMGANTVRLAHYQHSQYFYDLCDEKGLVVWAEIPYISNHLRNGNENAVSQMTELVIQNYNHPSIVVWGLSNEISMSGVSSAVIHTHKRLHELVHSLDKTRLTTAAVLSMCDPANEYVHISDVVSFNHYFGWYGGKTDMYGPWFDRFHARFPSKPVGLSEYGCEGLNWHATDIVQGDYTEEYQAYYHEELIRQIAVRPYLWATHVWNMFDFAADARGEGGENGMNHKGLVTFDRKYKKDSFYAYKAWLSREPVLHICGKRYVDRVEETAKITVYSNLDSVELFANGRSVGVKKKDDFPFFYFDVPNEGTTEIEARAGTLTDHSVIRKTEVFNEEYRMKEEGSVINWFEIKTVPGYCSVNDTIGDILATVPGKIAAGYIGILLLRSLTGGTKSGQKPKEKKKKNQIGIMGFKINRDMLQMAYGFTVRRGISMLGGKVPKEQILKINSVLNKVRKK